MTLARLSIEILLSVALAATDILIYLLRLVRLSLKRLSYIVLEETRF